MVVQEVLRIGKVNKLGMWVPHELPENRKNHCFEVLSSPFILNNNEPFLDQIMTWCNEKWILNNDQQRPVQWSDWEKALEILRKAKLSPKKKVMVTVWWSATSLIHYSFLNPSKTITSEKYAQQVDEMYQELWCLQLTLVNRMGPILLQDNADRMSHKQHFQSWWNWATKFCFIHHIHLTSFLPTD